MYNYSTDTTKPFESVGQFSIKKDAEFVNGVKHMLESLDASTSMNPIINISSFIGQEPLKEQYKELLLGDILNENDSFKSDPYLGTMGDKMEQLFENTSTEILMESSAGALQPIVGLSLPVMKKSFLELHSKDVVPVEIPNKPLITLQFERKYLRDAGSNKYYLPDVFYDDSYKSIIEKGRGNEIPSTWYPEGAGTLPISELNVLELAGGTLAKRDTLSLDFCIKGVKMDCGGTIVTIPVNITPDMQLRSIRSKIEYTLDGVTYTDTIYGDIDTYRGVVSVTCINNLIKKIQFGGHLSNENNSNGIEIGWERETINWQIPDGIKIDTGVTMEQIKDHQALYNIDYSSEMISDMATVMTQYEDSFCFDYLNKRFDEVKDQTSFPYGYKNGFTVQEQFSCMPDLNKYKSPSEWVNSELKFTLSRYIQKMKNLVNESQLMFVLNGHPDHISLLNENTKWFFDEASKVGGVQMEYSFGVLTGIGDRVHVVSSRKISKTRGIRCVAIPIDGNIITFKNYKYSMNIENGYRNPFTPLIPNVVGSTRFLVKDIIPLQGELHILNDAFGSTAASSPTLQVDAPAFDVAGGTYSTAQIITLSTTVAGTTIFYTVDGSTPTVSSPSVPTGTSITIAATSTVKAFAIKTGYVPSAVSEVSYTIE
jgi:hypothetical protein